MVGDKMDSAVGRAERYLLRFQEKQAQAPTLKAGKQQAQEDRLGKKPRA